MVKHAFWTFWVTVTVGTVAVLGSAPAQARSAVENESEVQVVMGPEQEYQRGLTVNNVAPTLRSVTVGEETILAYCIEYWVRAADPDHQAAVTGWDGFTGDNHFKTNPEVRQAVAWILHNSYPTLSLSELEDRTASTALTEAEAIAATQAAIWFYTDDFVSDGVLTVEAGPTNAAHLTDNSVGNVQNIFDYLTGEQNIGLTEQEVQASVTLEDASGTEGNVPDAVLETKAAEQDHLLGPVLVSSSSEHVNLQLETPNATVPLQEITVVDSQGRTIDFTEPLEAQELWVHVPADAATGGVQLIAESIEYGYTGRLIIPEPASDRRFQTIVVVDQTSDIASTELVLQWEQPVQIEPPVEEPPEEVAVEEDTTPNNASVDETAPTTQPIGNSPVHQQHASQSNQVSVTVGNAEHLLEPSEAVKKTVEPQQKTPAARSPKGQLAETGAHQTRNILVALGTIAVGLILTLVNRIRQRWA